MLPLLDEARRLDILRRYGILDTPPEDVFDRVARMASHHFRTPIGAVAFIDEARQWFKAVHGVDVREINRETAFCHHTIMTDKPMLVPDLTADPRFRDNPFVVEPPHFRFYAGAPLVTRDGFRLGTVSVLDYVPHVGAEEGECGYLSDLAALVVHELEMRLATSDVKAEIERRRQMEDRLRLALSHAPVMLATLDRALRYTWVINPPPPLAAADFIGKQDSDLWPAEVAEPHMAIKRAVMETGQSHRSDAALTIGGRKCTFDFTVEPLLEDGAIVGISCAAIDLTERKQAEAAVVSAEARHRAVLDTAVDAMVVIDQNGIVQQCNPATERIFGYSAAEIIGRNVAMLMPEPHRSAHDRYVANYLTTGRARIIGIGREVEGQRKDGTLVPLDLAIAEWGVGGARHFTGIMRDITRRRTAEKALRKAEAERAESLTLLHTIINGIPDPLFFKNTDGRYSIANQATARSFGRDSVIGMTDYELMPRVDADRLRAADLQVMASGQTLLQEERVPPGERWYLTAKFPLRDEKGGTLGVVGLARDITERRMMEEELKAAKDQAEAANRAKSTFLAAASHDLRQPVQAMVLFSSALQGRLRGHPAAPVVARMRQSLDALQMLLESLLDISRLDAGVVEVNTSVFPIAALLSRLVREYAVLASRKGVRFRSVPSRLWTMTDATLLERVLRNIIENAVRYTERGGVLIGCRQRRGHLLVQVLDTGIGIPADQKEAIFLEFAQLGNPERDRTKGLGLGLSIVRRLLALMGHDMEVVSTPGRGSCFSIQLPLVKAGAVPERRPEAPAPSSAGDGAKVLVIDDEAIVRQGLELLLADWGCQVIAVADAEEAVARVEPHHAPDAIIADYRLQGGRTGTEAIRDVHRACGRQIPAIILTGDTAPERIAEVTASGFAIAHKPIVPEKLEEFFRKSLVGVNKAGQQA